MSLLNLLYTVELFTIPSQRKLPAPTPEQGELSPLVRFWRHLVDNNPYTLVTETGLQGILQGLVVAETIVFFFFIFDALYLRKAGLIYLGLKGGTALVYLFGAHLAFARPFLWVMFFVLYPVEIIIGLGWFFYMIYHDKDNTKRLELRRKVRRAWRKSYVENLINMYVRAGCPPTLSIALLCGSYANQPNKVDKVISGVLSCFVYPILKFQLLFGTFSLAWFDKGWIMEGLGEMWRLKRAEPARDPVPFRDMEDWGEVDDNHQYLLQYEEERVFLTAHWTKRSARFKFDPDSHKNSIRYVMRHRRYHAATEQEHPLYTYLEPRAQRYLLIADMEPYYFDPYLATEEGRAATRRLWRATFAAPFQAAFRRKVERNRMFAQRYLEDTSFFAPAPVELLKGSGFLKEAGEYLAHPVTKPVVFGDSLHNIKSPGASKPFIEPEPVEKSKDSLPQEPALGEDENLLYRRIANFFADVADEGRAMIPAPNGPRTERFRPQRPNLTYKHKARTGYSVYDMRPVEDLESPTLWTYKYNPKSYTQYIAATPEMYDRKKMLITKYYLGRLDRPVYFQKRPVYVFDDSLGEFTDNLSAYDSLRYRYRRWHNRGNSQAWFPDMEKRAGQFGFNFDQFIPLMELDDVSNLRYGLLFILALSSLTVYSIILAGWSSNSKYAFLGALRSAAQMISYEVSIVLTLLPVVLLSGSLNLTAIVYSQISTVWYVLPLLPVALIFLVSMLAETNRTPFDLPEAEAELVAGYNVDYSSLLFAMFFLGEYLNMILMSVMFCLLYLGGWDGILFYDAFMLTMKAAVIWIFFVIVRATLPRYRYDQLMDIGWKAFLPFTLAFLTFAAGICVSFDILPVVEEVAFNDLYAPEEGSNQLQALHDFIASGDDDIKAALPLIKSFTPGTPFPPDTFGGQPDSIILSAALIPPPHRPYSPPTTAPLR